MRTYKGFEYIKIEAPGGEIIWSLRVGEDKVRFSTLGDLKRHVDSRIP